MERVDAEVLKECVRGGDGDRRDDYTQETPHLRAGPEVRCDHREEQCVGDGIVEAVTVPTGIPAPRAQRQGRGEQYREYIRGHEQGCSDQDPVGRLLTGPGAKSGPSARGRPCLCPRLEPPLDDPQQSHGPGQSA